MKPKSTAANEESAVWRRTIRLDGELTPSAARALLRLQFSTADRDRMRELSAKARAGSLTSREQNEIDAFEHLGCLLDILHSHARRALKRRKVP